MSNYTPATEEVRKAWNYWCDETGVEPDEFDRWLAAHDAEIMQQAYSLAGKLADSFLDTVRADEREKAAQRIVDAFHYYYGASPVPAWLLAAARGGEQE